jgi:tellurite methyltransferase
MSEIYEKRYDQEEYYWGTKPSSICSRVSEMLANKPLKVLDIGCGEGRDVVSLARKGHRVAAFDTSPKGIEKALRLAERAGVTIRAFTADINTFRLTEEFDVILSTGVFQYIPQDLRMEIIGNYRKFTTPGGLNAFAVFVDKPFIPRAPDAETTAHRWISGELLNYYWDWRIEYCGEDIFDCMSSGVPHQHAVSRIIARKHASEPGA